MVGSFFFRTSTLILFAIFFFPSVGDAQTKRIKRPRSTVGISSVDRFVRESFDLYDKVYKYDGYAENGTPLDDEDLDSLEDALTEISALSDSAPNILSDLDGAGAIKQARATLQINKAKKALKYSVKTIKELLAGQPKDQKSSESEEEVSDGSENNSYEEKNSNSDKETESDKVPSNISDDLEVLSKFDFVPGDKVLFFDDFARDFVGDFPSRWNTNASGEVVKVNGDKWFKLSSGYKVFAIPDFKGLPEDYTVEFDILTKGVDGQTSSNVYLYVFLSDTDDFIAGKKHYVSIGIPFAQYRAFVIPVKNFFHGKRGKIAVNLNSDIRTEVLNQPHISISVTKQRLRLWVNEVKYADIPRIMEEENVLDFIKFNLYGAKDGKERVFIKNLKIAEGGQDLRRKLMSEGKISTNGILFDSGSANIKKQSYGIIRQISQVLMQDDNIKLKIIGHTDSEGNEESNLKLSKSRAVAVKNALVDVYKISDLRLITDGMGESRPVGDNATSNGRAKNRRVEFIIE